MADKDLKKLGRLYAAVDTQYPKEELANLLGIPAPDKRQLDLQYFTSIFVSSGFNLNAAYFLPSELISADKTVTDKPLDVEHDQEKIVGHIYSHAFVHKDGTVFDPKELAETVGVDVEKVPMDIVTATRLYKARFPEVAADVESGKYSVSMECYYKDYDIIVDDIIIPKVEAKSLGLTQVVNNIVSVNDGKEELGKHRVGRVLRGILFSGCGLVESPANPESVILETATKDNDYILDLTKVESYMKMKQENEKIVIHSLEGGKRDLAYIRASYGGSHTHEVAEDKEETFSDGTHIHVVSPDTIPDGLNVYFVDDGSHRHNYDKKDDFVGEESSHSHKVYVGGSNSKEGFYALESSSSTAHAHKLESIDGVHSHTIVLKDGTELKSITPSDILKTEGSKMVKTEETTEQEDAGLGSADGVDKQPAPEHCVNYKRYVYEKGGDDPGVPVNSDPTPGLIDRVESLPAPGVPGSGDVVTQMDSIKHEDWCTLFDLECPVPGGLATDPSCYRLVLNRHTKEAVNSYYEQLQENRRKAGLEKSMASLIGLIKEAKDSIE